MLTDEMTETFTDDEAGGGWRRLSGSEELSGQGSQRL